MSREETTNTNESSITNTADIDTASTNDDLGTIRDLIVRAYPDIVPELLSGATINELTASIEPARNAYQRIVEQTTPPTTPITPPPAVPAGGNPPIVDFDRLPTTEKLRRGLAQRLTQQTNR